ncbi:MAG: peptide chain release factor N(5)-glutamine methyltransferase [Leptospirales bacterium]|nr:peptide chain release factor N(5)-glutamine methyltransferase [Leptospirales bacterium]
MLETISEARKRIVSSLDQAGVSNSDIEATILLREVTGMDTAKLFVDRNSPLQDEHQNRLEQMLLERCKRVPLAHVLGYTEFYGRRFVTRPGVLIPRKETEVLVEQALARNIPQESLVLDLACGSGCIGLTIAKERPDLTVHLSDVSDLAIAQTQENAAALSVLNFRLFQSNWFDSIVGRDYYAILTNPPYIHISESGSMEPEVLDHDPHIALFHENPVGLFERLLNDSHERLSAGGFFAAELSPVIASDVLRIAQKIYTSAQLISDYSGHERIILAQTK